MKINKDVYDWNMVKYKSIIGQELCNLLLQTYSVPYFNR